MSEIPPTSMGDAGAERVVESSGVFRTREKARAHSKGRVKTTSAPSTFYGCSSVFDGCESMRSAITPARSLAMPTTPTA